MEVSLSGVDPLVKRCVSRRLLRLDGFEKLAADLQLTLEEVKRILRHMRPWVRRYTTYYDPDRFWSEDGRKFTLPVLGTE